MSDDLTAWLREQVQARLELARKATPGPWTFEGDDPTDDEVCDAGDRTVAWTRSRQVPNGRHIEANDPREVIAQCEAQLAILDVLEAGTRREAIVNRAFNAWKRSGADPATRPGFGIGSRYGDPPCQDLETLRWAVRHLASGYRFRPGYREEWKP